MNLPWIASLRHPLPCAEELHAFNHPPKEPLRYMRELARAMEKWKKKEPDDTVYRRPRPVPMPDYYPPPVPYYPPPPHYYRPWQFPNRYEVWCKS